MWVTVHSKEISTVTKHLSEPSEPKDYSHKNLSDEGLESEQDEDNLEGTGLLPDQSEHSDQIDQEDSGVEDNQNNQIDQQQDVKPLIIAPINFDSTVPIVVDSDSDIEESEVNNDQQADVDLDCFIESFQPGTAPTKNIDRVLRLHKYNCYLCLETFTMQKSFVIHFQEKHSHDLFKCEFCQSDFKSSNGLFKHERSHEYLKHSCTFCSKKFQFPYQLEHHKRQHTGMGHIGCTKCPKTFGAKCSRDFHEKTHRVSMKCQLCPMLSTKTFPSNITLNLHVKGIHGPGWDTPCGEKHYKWKSSYTHHVLNCKK